ncbi:MULTISPECIES: MFS transporter [unclassified Sphingomonas]|uniref:MFS transporter n=1 Tax=unclassified Sphingomonas TaxID=196159 RepID=UPI0006F70270|nr:MULTISPECIES: MFS transporter [unclassified Sphingomonas]KQX19692.1 MFS transporter [Sphingomonas sp. Root1294]KQY65893.1 MFS transporter [Sphingomonas sp. Root50]KRB95537.1 MFS transporter [Sphingomonas sp. Root720]
MFAAVQPVRSLLLSIFMLMAGSGFLATLISLRLERRGTGTIAIGIVATAYFAGLIIGALRAGSVIRRVGHIRAFAAFVALLSASTLAYALLAHPLFWTGLRLIDGICVAGVFVCLESWLNDRSAPDVRGSVLAAYMVALYSGQAIGQLLLGASGTLPAIPFQLASMLVSLAIIPLCLTRSSAPAPIRASAFTIRSLLRASPLGATGAFATGAMLGAFYGLAAVHVRRLGLDLAETARFMMIVILGGVMLQWPLGRLSDRYDRRRVIIASFAAAALISLALALQGSSGGMLLILGALFGGLCFALYPLCVAHCNDRLLESERVAASGRLVLLYSIGAALGPVCAAGFMTFAGTGGLFQFIALCALLALAFGLWRQKASPPVPDHEQQEFQIVPRTTPMASLLDPNTLDARATEGRAS